MIYHDLPFERYLKIKALNSSSLKDFIDSPVLYLHNKQNPRKESASFKFGTMMHTWVLERDRFDALYAFLDEDTLKAVEKFRENPLNPNNYMPAPEGIKKTQRNAWKEIQKDIGDKILVYKEEYDAILSTYNVYNKTINRTLFPEEIRKNLETIDLQLDGQNELTVEFEHRGVKCKARFDSIIDNYIYDVKTSANVHKFERDISNYKYYVQAGFYSIAYEKAFDERPRGFKHVVIPNKMPYSDFRITEMHPEYVEYGIDLVNRYIDEFKMCQDRDEFVRRDVEETIYKPNYL